MPNFLNFNKRLKKFRVKRTFKESIEPEEILLDATRPQELAEQKIEVPIRPQIFRLFFILIVAAFLILTGRAAYFQIWRGDYYQNLSAKNATRQFPIFAARGIIYDRNLRQMVYNIPSFDLVVTPQDLPRNVNERQEIIARASQVAQVAPEEIKKQIDNFDLSTGQSFSVANNLTHEQVLVLEAEISQMPGFRIEENAVRQYEDASYFSHILGYLSKVQTEDLKKNSDYFLTEKIGRAGLETTYENVLRGKIGKKVYEVDALGRMKRQIMEAESEAGQSLVLSVDAALQKKLQDSLAAALKRLGLKKGAAVALDPKTGGVLALVSLPSFDSNLFSQGLDSKNYADLKNDSARPLFNRAIAGQYAPGSTVKPLIASAALQESIILPRTQLFCSGELALMSQYNLQIAYRFGDWKEHGAVDMYKAIAESCDVYFYTIGGGYGKIEGLGVERLVKYFREFGLGKILNIDLPGEKTGLVPDSNWKKDTKNENWYIGDTYNISIGQGDLLVTPLQLAAATAAVANGGLLLQPRVVDKIVDSDKNVIKTIEPIVLNQKFVDAANFSIVRKGMRQTVTDGSARLLNNLTVEVAAKTGTAQVPGEKNSNAWATVFAPYDDPQIVLAILAENAGEGSAVAIPVASEVLADYFSQ